MSEIKHTPGPWTTIPEESDKPYVQVRGTQLGERYKIANVLKPVYQGAGELEAKETGANAHLIAAAPDLLEALETLLSYSSVRNALECNDLDKAEAIVAKARGES